MTRRKSRDYKGLGNKIYEYRMKLSLDKSSREFFLSDRIKKGIIDERELSIDTLSNIENGYTLPNLVTLVSLAAALEIDQLSFFEALISTLPERTYN